MYFLKYVCESHKQKLSIKYVSTFQMILGIYVIHVFLKVYTI